MVRDAGARVESVEPDARVKLHRKQHSGVVVVTWHTASRLIAS